MSVSISHHVASHARRLLHHLKLVLPQSGRSQVWNHKRNFEPIYPPIHLYLGLVNSSRGTKNLCSQSLSATISEKS